MKKKPFRMLKMGMISCALFAGIVGAVLPAAAEAADGSAQTVTASPIVKAEPISAGIQATGQAAVKEVKLTTSNVNLNADIKVPQFTGLADAQYQEKLNDIILTKAKQDLASMEKEANEGAQAAQDHGYTYRPYILYINYELKSDGSGQPTGVVSLVVTTYISYGNTGMPRVDAYNFLNTPTVRLVKLDDLLGADYKAKVDTKVKAEIAEHPENFFPDEYKGIGDNRTFYVAGNEAVVVFSKYEIAPGVAGTPEFKFPLPADLKIEPKTAGQSSEKKLTVQLGAADLGSNESGVQLIPLRKVAEGLGYTVKWNQDTYAAELSKGAEWTSVRVGKDSYSYARMAPVELGAAPVIKNDTLYVPLKFASDILKAAVKADGANVTIEQ
ncbi:stalk domain-containing protein [Paenibacillus ferrarius]|uniref:stalk domain-containing protein n=1 Tax=Paenibacillus ferrarius TaxID=1469647 RepID=UPI003D2C2377